MRKKLFTLSELNEYVKTGRSFQYIAQDEKEEIGVTIECNMVFASSDDNENTEGLVPVVLKACHTGTNINKTNIPEKAMKKALPSFANRPILAYIHEVDGQPEFYGHNMEEGQDGEIIYYEKPVGIIPESCEARLEYDEENNKTYVIVKGYLYAEYSKAVDILERECECSCSVELSVRELSYNAKEKVLVLDDFYFSGVTILGKDDDGNKINPGMVGSNIQLAQFEQTPTLIETLEKLTETLSRFNINNNQTGKEETTVTLFERLLEQYGKTVEDITFEYEGLSDEELEAKFAEAFGEAESEEPNGEEETGIEGADENESTEGTDTTEEPTESEEDPVNEPETVPVVEEKSVEFSVNYNGQIRTFSLSLNEKLAAMYNLINATYGELDNEWYDVTVYDDTKTVEMFGYFTGKAYRQTYKLRSDEFSLVGDRVEIFCKWMTADELSQFENMKANYAALEQYKNDKEAEISHNEKMDLLVDYSSIADTDEYKDLVSNIDTYSNEEVVEKANAIVGKYALKGFTFSATPAPTPERHFCGFGNNKDESKKTAPSYANFFE
ncbi:MAG: hypothetical protein K5655_04340 [Lachnospiraceae bacterium]|nr:hypothetical protein [Lachnospiraceae bacterium]